VTPFAYERAADVVSAVKRVRGNPRAAILGAGTNLIDHMRLGIAHPELLVDISRLPLDRIDALPDGGVRIGANVRNSDLPAHPLIRERHPLLSEALLAGASCQLRNSAICRGRGTRSGCETKQRRGYRHGHDSTDCTVSFLLSRDGANSGLHRKAPARATVSAPRFSHRVWQAGRVGDRP
jgi:FAD binding domain in molybdopterin dehydrogenase